MANGDATPTAPRAPLAAVANGNRTVTTGGAGIGAGGLVYWLGTTWGMPDQAALSLAAVVLLVVAWVLGAAGTWARDRLEAGSTTFWHTLLSRLGVLVLFALVAGSSSPAIAACQGDDATCQLDWRSGTPQLKLPLSQDDGNGYPTGTQVACVVEYFDGSATPPLEGDPGEVMDLVPPKVKPTDPAQPVLVRDCVAKLPDGTTTEVGQVTRATAQYPALPFRPPEPAQLL